MTVNFPSKRLLYYSDLKVCMTIKLIDQQEQTYFTSPTVSLFVTTYIVIQNNNTF